MLIESGNIEEIIYARLDPGADLLEALWDICRQKDVKTGVLLDCTGSMESLVVQRWPRVQNTDTLSIDFVTIEGPLEITAHGIIGEGVEAKGKGSSKKDLMPVGFEVDGDPYLHIHPVATNSDITVCGHLMRGSIIHGRTEGTDDSHFTVVIAKVEGVRFRGVYEEVEAAGDNYESGLSFYHDLVHHDH
jgi:predicted DNA-binding protein with PD1-like motif